MSSLSKPDHAGNNAASPEAWAAFLGWLLEQRAGRCDDISALAHYVHRGLGHARRGYSGRDLFGVRLDWGYRLGERSVRAAIAEFLEFLRKRAGSCLPAPPENTDGASSK